MTRSVSGFYGLACVVIIVLGGCGGGGDNGNDANDNAEDDSTITTIAEAREELASTNQAPIADLQVFDRVGEGVPVRPTHVDLDASGSSDPDGFVEHYTFQLFDADTGAVLAGPVFTREPFATLRSNRDLPSRLRATVAIEDDEGEIHTAEISLAGPDTSCSANDPALFRCTLQAGVTECQPTALNTSFSTGDLLTAAQQCDPSITSSTPLRISAWGGGGGRGANNWPFKGGAGGLSGLASLGTTVAELDSLYPDSPFYCYGLGRQGWFQGLNNGSGGASTILRTCNNVSQNTTTGVLLIAGGGGGGALVGSAGGKGGVALSTTSGSCPPNDGCKAVSTDMAGGFAGDGGGAGGAAGAGGAQGPGGAQIMAGPGADGVGGGGGTSDCCGPVEWIQGNSEVSGSTGSGGATGEGSGGAGGGGYGGGGGGGTERSEQKGGGGGGSFAAQSTIAYDNPDVGASLPGSLGFFFTPQSASQD